MKNIPLTRRLVMLGDGRKHYLEFLRNLPVQGVLFGLMLFAVRKLDMQRIDWSNWRANVVAWLLIGAFMLAFFANLFLFVDNTFAALGRWAAHVQRRMRRRGCSEISVPLRLLIVICQRRRVEACEVVVVLLLLLGGATAPFALGIFSVLGWRQFFPG